MKTFEQVIREYDAANVKHDDVRSGIKKVFGLTVPEDKTSDLDTHHLIDDVAGQIAPKNPQP